MDIESTSSEELSDDENQVPTKNDLFAALKEGEARMLEETREYTIHEIMKPWMISIRTSIPWSM